MTQPAGAAWPLRPLGLGEMLDRAITLTIRNFPLFALIAILYALPQGVLAYYGSEDQAQLFGGFTDALREAAAGKHVDMDAVAQGPNPDQRLQRLYRHAVLVALRRASALHDGADLRCFPALSRWPVTVGSAYRGALQRTASLIAITLT